MTAADYPQEDLVESKSGNWVTAHCKMVVAHVYPDFATERTHLLCSGCWCGPQIIEESTQGIVWSHNRGH